MTPIDITYAGLGLAYVVLEYWLGKTDKVKAGSAVEFLLIAIKAIVKTKKE